MGFVGFFKWPFLKKTGVFMGRVFTTLVGTYFSKTWEMMRYRFLFCRINSSDWALIILLSSHRGLVQIRQRR